MKKNDSRKDFIVKDVIVKCAADVFAPISLIFGLYIILHGHLSPGGGFQGGVLVAGAAVLVYLAYGHKGVTETFNMDVLKKNEAIGAVAYTLFALVGLAFGANFARNVFYNLGNPGDLISSGTIMFMNLSVGYKVLTGVSFLILLMIGLLAPESNEN